MSDLAARLSKGEESAFAEFYDACADKLFRYLRHRLGGEDSASEVLQEVFVKMVKHQRRLRRVEHLESYVFQIAYNEANRWIRRNKKTASLEKEPVANETEQQAVEYEEQVEFAMTRLDGLDRDIIQLKVFGELTFKNVADAMGLPQGTVSTRYRRALQRLREILEGEYR